MIVEPLTYECPSCGHKEEAPPHSHIECKWCLLTHKTVLLKPARALELRRAGITNAESTDPKLVT